MPHPPVDDRFRGRHAFLRRDYPAGVPPDPAPTQPAPGLDPRRDLHDARLPAPVRAVFTRRSGGVSAAPYDALNLSTKGNDEWRRVQANRDLVARGVGLRYDDLVFAQQVHGHDVAVVDRSDISQGPAAIAGDIAGVDALVTRRRGLGLVVLAADCLPVLLADVTAGVIGAAHAGRRGLASGVLQATVEAMVGLGAQGITASIGPAAGRCCYEVPAELAAEVELTVPGCQARTRRHTPSIDLRGGAERILLALGLTVRHVDACTIHDPGFYSYRRDGDTGRHGGVVVLP